MQLFVHGQQAEAAEIIEVRETMLVRELIAGREGNLIWIEDVEVPLELDITLVQAGVAHGHHVHRGPCREIEIEVHTEGRVLQHHFAPSVGCRRVAVWCAHQLGLGDASAVELIDPSTGAVVDPGRHVGSLARHSECTAQLELRRVHHEVHVVINASPHTVPAGSITFGAIVALAYPTSPGPDPEYTVSYRKGHPGHAKGSLLEGRSVEVREGMIFVVTATDKS